MTLIATLCGVSPASADRFRGRPLAEVLDELQQRGLEIVYSTALVSRQRVSVEPATAEPREILDAILQPLGLLAREGERGTILIVARPADAPSIRGRVVSSIDGRPVAGAMVSIERLGLSTVSADDGSYALEETPPGRHRVSFEAEGFGLLEYRDVKTKDAGVTKLDVALETIVVPSVELIVLPGALSVMQQEQAARRTIAREDALLVPTIGGDISRVIELLPGVTAADNSAAFHVRGGDGEDVSLILDGLELYDAFHLKSFQSPFTVIDSNIVDVMEFVGSGYTAERGDRHGGFVDLETRTPAQETAGEVEVGTLNSRLALRGPLADGGGGWLGSARAWYPEAVQDTIELGGGERVDPRFSDAYGKATFIASPNTILSFHLLSAYDRVSFQERDPVEPEGNESAEAITRNHYAWFRLLSNPSERWLTQTTLSGGRIERNRHGISVPQDDRFEVIDHRTADFFGLKHTSSWRIGSAQALRAGLDIRSLSADYRYESEPTDDPDSAESARLSPSGDSLALFVAHRARLSSRVAVELGLRWARQDYTDDSNLNPRFNLLWHAGDSGQFRLAAGRVTQSQRIHELRVEDGERAFLPAETSEHLELTYEQRLPANLRLRFDAYYRELSDLRPRYENLFTPIELFPETGDDRIEIAADEAILQGVELTLRGDPSRPWNWWVSYALSSADDRIDGEAFPRSWDQTHAGKILLAYRRDDRWWISLAGSMHSGWPTTPVEGQLVEQDDGSFEIEPSLGARNSRNYPRFVRVDAKARRSFELSRGRLSFTAEVVNLLDRRNVCCVDEFEFEALPDSSIETRRTLDHWLGITPSFNVLWEF